MTRLRMGSRTAVVIAFACSGVYFTGFFPPRDNPNELSRIEAAVAFVESGTFSIDSTIERLGTTQDKSVWKGRYFSNKAPGLIFAMVPVYRALRVVFAEPTDGWSGIFVLVRLATVTLLSVVALARFARRVDRSCGRAVAPVVAFAVAFGTPFLFYSRSLFSHAWTASLLFLSWDLIRSSEEERRNPAARLAIAGFLAGLAAISEYPAALVAAALAFRAAAGPLTRRMTSFAIFAAGALPALLALALYDRVCFGSPLRLSSACEADPAFAAIAAHSFFGIRFPRPRAVVGTLFSFQRGAVLFSPFWLWAVPGWARWWRSRADRRDCVFSLVSAFLIWLPITAYPNWDGGWSFGMRYLLPAVFFAALPIPHALGSARSRGLFLVAVAFSAAFHGLGSFAWPHFSQFIPWPAVTESAWFVAHGAVAPNLGLLIGIPPLVSLVPALLLILAAIVAAVAAYPPSRPARAAAAVIGVAIFAATIALPIPVSASDRQERQMLASPDVDRE